MKSAKNVADLLDGISAKTMSWAEQLRKFDAEQVLCSSARFKRSLGYLAQKNPGYLHTGQSYPQIVKSTAMMNHYYGLPVDRDFEPLFLKFYAHFLYDGELCLNARECAKLQLKRKCIG
jgi:hypothetical protein